MAADAFHVVDEARLPADAGALDGIRTDTAFNLEGRPDFAITLEEIDKATIKLAPKHADAHIALGAFHAEVTAVRTKVHDMLVQKKTKDEIWAMLQRDHKWNQFQQRSVDGLLLELQ